MTTKTHQLIGLTAATVGFFVLQPDEPVTLAVAGVIIAGSFFGSILPDIDQPTSNFWDSVPLGGIFGQIVPKTLGGHRNLSHSILGYLLGTWLVQWVVHTVFREGLFDQALFLQSFQIGFLFHLIADAVTIQGIPLFWPLGGNIGFPPRPLHGIRIVTGKWFENLVVFPVLLGIFSLVLAQHWSRFCHFIPCSL